MAIKTDDLRRRPLNRLAIFFEEAKALGGAILGIAANQGVGD